MDCNDILIKCYDRNFVKDRAINDQILTIEELVILCEDLQYEVDSLEEKIKELEQNIEDNYRPISLAEQYDIDNSDFI